MLEARNCNIRINNTGIMAQNVTLNSSNSVVPVQSVGKRGFDRYVPNGPVTHTLSIDYVLKTEREPNYQIYNSLKNLSDSSSHSPALISIGGITGNFYLNSYSVSSSPNNISKAQASYVNFDLSLSGYLNDSKQDNYSILTTESGEDIETEDGLSLFMTEGSLDYAGDYDGFANGWTTFLYENAELSQDPVYDFGYSFQAEWEPTYLIGSKTASQVDLMNYRESISLIREVYTKPKYSGEDIYLSQNESGDFDGTNRDLDLRIYGLYRLCNGTGDFLSFSLSGANITSSTVNFQLNDMVLTETTATRIG